MEIMNGAHTPGPWFGFEDEGVWADAEQNVRVFETGCGCCTSSTLTKANARLIAAAPELLAALEDAADKLEAEGIMATMQRAAIAKAKGKA